MAKISAPVSDGSLLGGLTPEMVEPIKGSRSTKYSKTDVDAATAVLVSTYESGKAAKFTLADEDAVKKLVNLFRHVALNSSGGVAIKAEGNVLYIKGKDRKQMTDKPRKPRETKGLAGTPEYDRRMAEYNDQLAAWKAQNGQ